MNYVAAGLFCQHKMFGFLLCSKMVSLSAKPYVMDFRTAVSIEPLSDGIVYGDKLLFLGSCFADEVGKLCRGAGFDAEVNPFGVQFNPASIAWSVELLGGNRLFTEDDVVEVGGEFYCTFNHSTEFWNRSADGLLESVNSSLISSRKHFAESKWVIVSLGTSWVYRHKERGCCVSNCHKQPSQMFEREFLSVGQSVELLKGMVERFPKKQFVFTVSPLRHLKDGLHENQLSKSALLLAVDQVCTMFGNAQYFPAYELLLDELRDYRFYKEDMIHPTEQAVCFIWDKFIGFGIAGSEREAMQLASEFSAMNRHRPFFPESESYRKFGQKRSEKETELRNRFPKVKIENLF